MSAGWGAAIGAAVQGIGNRRSTNKSERAAADINNQADLLARSGIQMRAEDARRAGLSPLAALGLPLAAAGGGTVVGADYSGMGQSIERAIDAYSQRGEKGKLSGLAIERAELENDYIRAQIRQLQGTGTGPGLPSATHPAQLEMGQGDAVDLQPNRIYASEPGQPSKEAGAVSDYGFARTSSGFRPVPSQDVKQRIEDQFVLEDVLWPAANLVMPSGDKKPPRKWLKSFPGAVDWSWNQGAFEWQPLYRDKRTGRLTRVPKPAGLYRR